MQALVYGWNFPCCWGSLHFKSTRIHPWFCDKGLEKQVPMAFILMSKRRTKDYVKVLTSLKQSLEQVSVEGFVMDFEQAAWLAVRQVFPGATVKGCVLHFTQAVWRKVQEVGLKPAYSRRATIYNYIRLLLGLPFLPYTHIEPAFQELSSRANSEPLLLRHLRDGISTRRVRPAARKIDEKIRELWKNYSAGNIQTSELLEGCASAYGPQCEE